MNSYSEQQNRLSRFLAQEYSNLISYVKRNIESADAEDVVQDVALNLFTKADLNAPIENLFAYVYRSLKNKIIDLQRKKKELRLDDFEDEQSGENLLLRNFADDPDEFADSAAEELKLEQLYECIDELRPDQQDIILATEIEGYTFEELSREWEIPMGTLLSRKHRAMAKLQTIMKGKFKN